MDALRHRIHTTYKNAAEAVMSTRTSSAFHEKGVLTPEEFVEAGDYLVHVCPTWSWQAGDPRKARSFLPPSKQFLITRGVPCLRRASAVEAYGASQEVEVEPDEQGEGWLAAGVADDADGLSRALDDGFEDILEFSKDKGAKAAAREGAGGEGGDVPGAGTGAGAVWGARAGHGAGDSDAEDIESLEDSVGGDDEEDGNADADGRKKKGDQAVCRRGAAPRGPSGGALHPPPPTARSSAAVPASHNSSNDLAAASKYDEDDDDDDVPDLSDLELDTDDEDNDGAMVGAGGPLGASPALPRARGSSPPPASSPLSRRASSTVTRVEGGEDPDAGGGPGRLRFDPGASTGVGGPSLGGTAVARSEGSEASVFSGGWMSDAGAPAGRGTGAEGSSLGGGGPSSSTAHAGAAPFSSARPAAPSASSIPSSVLRTRTYDLLITYDKYYQVPRLWLLGYDEHRAPLPPQAVLDDVSQEHARKTVTIDPHPHGSDGVLAASIHPCKHANVLKRLSRTVARDGKPFQVQHALVLFLKFIAGVVPTIDYDYTMAAGGEG